MSIYAIKNLINAGRLAAIIRRQEDAILEKLAIALSVAVFVASSIRLPVAAVSLYTPVQSVGCNLANLIRVSIRDDLQNVHWRQIQYCWNFIEIF